MDLHRLYILLLAFPAQDHQLCLRDIHSQVVAINPLSNMNKVLFKLPSHLGWIYVTDVDCCIIRVLIDSAMLDCIRQVIHKSNK